MAYRREQDKAGLGVLNVELSLREYSFATARPDVTHLNSILFWRPITSNVRRKGRAGWTEQVSLHVREVETETYLEIPNTMILEAVLLDVRPILYGAIKFFLNCELARLVIPWDWRGRTGIESPWPSQSHTDRKSVV